MFGIEGMPWSIILPFFVFGMLLGINNYKKERANDVLKMKEWIIQKKKELERKNDTNAA